MEYKGYISQFTYDENLELFLGHVGNVNDVILFQGKSIESLRFAFKDAINEYLSWCKKIGKEPEKPFSLPQSWYQTLALSKRILGTFKPLPIPWMVSTPVAIKHSGLEKSA